MLSAMWQGPRRTARLAGPDRGVLSFVRVPYKTLKALPCLFPPPAEQKSRSTAVAQPAACLPSASTLQPVCLSMDESKRSFGQ